jgi:mRNA interferase MazF
MPPRTLPGEIWRVDLGLAAKIRPALVLSEFPKDDELALVLIIPHTTAIRGNRWEVQLPKPFLRPGVFHLQQLQPVPISRLEVRLGCLTTDEFQILKRALTRVLNLGVADRTQNS